MSKRVAMLDDHRRATALRHWQRLADRIVLEDYRATEYGEGELTDGGLL